MAYLWPFGAWHHTWHTLDRHDRHLSIYSFILSLYVYWEPTLVPSNRAGKWHGCVSCLPGSCCLRGRCTRNFCRTQSSPVGTTLNPHKDRWVTWTSAVGESTTAGELAAAAKQDKKAAAALYRLLRIQSCHIAHLFKRSKKPGFSCEMSPRKPTCGLVQSSGCLWVPGALVASLPGHLTNKKGLPVIKSHELL